VSGLFDSEDDERRKQAALAPAPADAPLAERMRPSSLDDVVGQEHLLNEGGILRAMLEGGLEQSLVLWGPPGVGKTTLARLVAAESGHRFEPFSAVLSGIADIKRVMREAEDRRKRSGSRTLLFVDEIHRFNKAQQDAFLPYVERGDILLVGATTENPSFEVNSALLSRARVVVLEALDEQRLVALLRRAVEDPERGLGNGLVAVDEALVEIARASDGDARRALTLLETCALLAGCGGELSPSILARALQRKVVRYDKSGDQHYDLVSALHKSIRNGNDDATVYWLTRMLEAGEDRDFLMRRLVRIAVEDIGLADPDALPRTVAAWDAWKRLGSPEGELAIVQAAVLLARAPKSNAAYKAYDAAREDVGKRPNESVPLHLCNAPTGLMKALGRGAGYRYVHDDPAAAEEMECLPESLRGRRYFGDDPT
jgi:putative ATPase